MPIHYHEVLGGIVTAPLPYDGVLSVCLGFCTPLDSLF